MAILTLAEYKAIKNRTKTEDDVHMQLVIDTVNTMIESFIGRNPYLEENIEEFVSLDYDTDIIFTKKWPITSISSVREVPQGISLSNTLNHRPLYLDEDYTFEDDRIYKLNGKNWSTGSKRVRIVYSAGYDEIPAALKLAAVELADFYIKEEYLQSRVAGNTTVTNLVSDIAKIPAHIRMVLNTYR